MSAPQQNFLKVVKIHKHINKIYQITKYTD